MQSIALVDCFVAWLLALTSNNAAVPLTEMQSRESRFARDGDLAAT
jgi:hypothetical protein